MSQFSEIFKKLTVKEETESSQSSEEMIAQNSTTLNNMGYACVEPGKFSGDERTDLNNVDKNRAEQPDENGNYSSDPKQCEINPEHPEGCTCPECLASVNDDEENVLAKEILGVDAVVIGESNFRKAFAKVMLESDYVGPKQWNGDLRITANQVKRALDDACPGVKGIQVVEELVGEAGANKVFKVEGGVDWDQYDKDQQLPKKLDVENVQLELDKNPESFEHGIDGVPARESFIYRVVGTNSAYPIPTDQAL